MSSIQQVARQDRAGLRSARVILAWQPEPLHRTSSSGTAFDGDGDRPSTTPTRIVRASSVSWSSAEAASETAQQHISPELCVRTIACYVNMLLARFCRFVLHVSTCMVHP